VNEDAKARLVDRQPPPARPPAEARKEQAKNEKKFREATKDA
jgi:hypothetical protein